MLVALLASIAIVLCAISAIESSDDGMRSLKQIERDMMDKDE